MQDAIDPTANAIGRYYVTSKQRSLEHRFEVARRSGPKN
jgi:hypothetical protein